MSLIVSAKKVSSPSEAQTARLRVFGDECFERINKRRGTVRDESASAWLLLLDTLREAGVMPRRVAFGKCGKPYFVGESYAHGVAERVLRDDRAVFAPREAEKCASAACVGCREVGGFSLSHHGGVVFCAVCDSGDVGADVMALPFRRGAEVRRRLAERCFAPKDVAPAKASDEAFVGAWTRLEAYSKYLGGNLCEVFGKALPDDVACYTFSLSVDGVRATASVCRDAKDGAMPICSPCAIDFFSRML